MFTVTHPFAHTSTTHIVLFLAAAAALATGPVAAATASQAPEPSPTHTTKPTQIGWQATVNELAAQARGTRSLATRRTLHNEITTIMHSHRTW